MVDAFAAQHATAETKPIGVFFSVIGLFLHVERGWTGRQVQQLHVRLARQKQGWPRLALPEQRGELTSVDVLAARPGPDRDNSIDSWCASVWKAYVGNRALLLEYLEQHDR